MKGTRICDVYDFVRNIRFCCNFLSSRDGAWAGGSLPVKSMRSGRQPPAPRVKLEELPKRECHAHARYRRPRKIYIVLEALVDEDANEFALAS
jgi:hypothetical protein